MFKKVDLRPVLKEHFATLRDFSTGRVSVSDFIAFYGLPVLLGAGLAVAGVRLQAPVVHGLLTAYSIFVGLLLNLLVMVHAFLGTTHGNPQNTGLQVRKRVLRELTANMSYAILVAIALVAVGLIALARAGVDASIPPVECFLLAAGSVNFLLTLLMVLRRMYLLLQNEFDRHKIDRAA